MRTWKPQMTENARADSGDKETGKWVKTSLDMSLSHILGSGRVTYGVSSIFWQSVSFLPPLPQYPTPTFLRLHLAEAEADR